jgi:hypothetical protein
MNIKMPATLTGAPWKTSSARKAGLRLLDRGVGCTRSRHDYAGGAGGLLPGTTKGTMVMTPANRAKSAVFSVNTRWMP